jgi:tRNA (guanine-N7-)-methyltransferase
VIEGAYPQRRLHGRRKGPRLSAHQTALRETLLPQLLLEPRAGADPRTYFSSPVEDVWLEIGFGAGEHLLWQAQAHPRNGVIGVEPYIAGTARLLSKIAAENGDARLNLRLYEGDAHDLLDVLPDASLGKVFVLFPDPWPKTRHHKRRFIQMQILDRLAQLMRPGAELRFASDDAGYFAWALERLVAHDAFSWMAARASDWTLRPADWPPTRYEAKALHGPPRYLRFLRR